MGPLFFQRLPSLKAAGQEFWGYSRLSLRDSLAAVVPFGPNGHGVQQYELWVMTSPGEGEKCAAMRRART
ncbi:MAG TPA: hypothetical protein VK579_10845, partial [Terriglobales bacterium]|nr:hypothetical protein [Terriglobales bacterium]